ncbi:MAG: histidinol-phosphatase [Isosphaeraceae bacterium]|jgi:predicted metal-dependent phosphoesterase TrpH|nr:MAG: histidinol-phosphatase [Isosphaeraceae bacterium]
MMRIDQHVHTSRYSPDSLLDPEELLEQARAAGLDGVVITEHDILWAEEELEELRRRAPGLVVLAGVEVSAREGHFLVYGLKDLKDLEPGIPLADLLEVVGRRGAAIVAAHPFRWDQDFEAIAREYGVRLDALELVSNNMTLATRERTEQVWRRLGCGRTGSSDAHEREVVGCYFTEYEQPIRTLEDLVRGLKSRRFRPWHREGVNLTCGPVDCERHGDG